MGSYRTLFFASMALAVVSITTPASATTYLFQLSGSRDAVFTIDTTPAPSFKSSSVFGDQILYSSVAGSYGNIVGNAMIGFGTGVFATLNVLGTPQGFTQFVGPDLFSLVNAAPVFKTGTFQLNSIVSGASTLRISEATSAVPEPATWAMFIGGFGLIGVGMRRKKTKVRFA